MFGLGKPAPRRRKFSGFSPPAAFAREPSRESCPDNIAGCPMGACNSTSGEGRGVASNEPEFTPIEPASKAIDTPPGAAAASAPVIEDATHSSREPSYLVDEKATATSSDVGGSSSTVDDITTSKSDADAERTAAAVHLQAAQRGHVSRATRPSHESINSDASRERLDLDLGDSPCTTPSRSVKIKKRPPLTPRRYRTPAHDSSAAPAFTFTKTIGRDAEGDTESTCTSLSEHTTAGIEEMVE